MQSSQANNGAKLIWQWGGHWYSLPFSRDDVLSLARAVNEEGHPREGVAWALLQRVAWLRTRGAQISVGKLVQQYAQPINPSWFPTGAKHLAEIARLERVGDLVGVQAENNRAKARIGKAAKPWQMLDPETKEIIERLLSGATQSPVKGAVHYWASHGADFAANQAKKPELVLLDRGYGFGPGNNVFFAEKGSQNFGGIRVLNGNESNPGDGGLLVAGMGNPMGLFAGAFIGYLAWEWLS